MRIVAFSDTHGFHGKIVIPEGDVLVFAGDMSMDRYDGKCSEFISWFVKLPHKHKIFIAGNHDIDIERRLVDLSMAGALPANVHYLEEGSVVIDGVKFHGSPTTPVISGNWAFEAVTSKRDMAWDFIGDDTQVLITHGPPYKKLDLLAPQFRREGENPHVGCPLLLKRIDNLPDLKVHIFGHIHEQYGTLKTCEETPEGAVKYIDFCNVSICDADYEPINKPIVIDI